MLEPLFVKRPVFTINRTQLFHYDGIGRYVFLKIPELLNDVIFQNSFGWLIFKTPQETIACSKLTAKNTRNASVNIVRVSLSLAWNIILKSVPEFVFNKMAVTESVLGFGL